MADNSVNIPVTLDLSGVKTGVQQIDKAFQEAAGSSKKANNTIKQGLDSTQKELTDTKVIITDINNSIRNWEREMKKATNPQDIAKLNNKIREAKQEISNINATTKKAGTEIKTFADSANEQFGRIGAAIAAAFAFGAIKQFIGESIHAFKEQEEALVRLELAYGNNKQGLEEMVSVSAEFQQKLNIPDEVFMTQAAFLKTQGRTNEEIKKIIKTAQGLKTAMGVDLQGAVLALNETYDGNISRMGRYIKTGTDLSANALKQGSAINALEEQYGALGEEMAKTTLGQTEKAALNFNNLQEVIGGTVINLLEEIKLLPELNKELEAVTTGLENNHIPAWQKFASFFGGDITQLDRAVQIQRAAMERLLIIAEEGSETEQLIAKKKIEGLIRYDEKFKDIYIELYNERHKKTEEETETHVEKIVKTEKKGIDEIAKANEELLAKLRALEIENTEDKQLQIRMRLEDEIKAVEKSKGNEETKQKIISELIIKGHREIEDLENEHQLRMKTIGERGNVSAMKLLEDKYGEMELRSEEIVKKNADRPNIELASFLGIELKEGDELEKLKEALQQAGEIISEYVTNALSEYTRLKEGAVDQKTQQINENMRLLEFEQKQEELGYANNVTALKKRDLELKKERDKAQKELEKAKENELAVNTALEASNMIVAIAKIYKDSGPVLGTILAAAMVAAFAVSKSQAIDAAKTTKYAKGGTWVLDGASHEQGGISLGDGREAEGGERVAIFSKDATRRNSGLSALVDSINKGQLVIDKDKMTNLVNGGNNIVVNVGGQKELQNIEKLLYEQSLKSTSARSYRYGNTLTIYRN